jgi:HAD superfamily hydrolase (TIGR01549 family)
MAPLKRSVGEAFRMYGLREDGQQAFHRYEDRIELQPVIEPFEGVAELLRAIISSGASNYIYSHRDKSVFYYLSKFGIADCFADCVTSEQAFASKPAPDALLYLIQKHGMDKRETLMLGDREIDVLCGKNAGVYTCQFDEFARRPPTEATYRVTEIAALYDILALAGPAK